MVTGSRKDADVIVDITDPESIRAMYEQASRVDAVACAAGSVPWLPLDEITQQHMQDGLAGKVVSQTELVCQGQALVA